MAQEERVRHRRSKSGKESISHRHAHKGPSGDDESAAAGASPPDRPATLDALRKARLKHLSQTPADRRRKMKMSYVGEVVLKAPAMKEEVRYVRRVSDPRKRHKPADPDRKHRHHKIRVSERKAEHSDKEQYVYKTRADTKTKNESRKSEAATLVEDKTRERPRPTTRSISSVKLDRDREERRIPRRRQTEPTKRLHSYGIDDCEPVRR